MNRTASQESGTPRKDRRQEIVEKAREILALEGPTALTMRRVADEVGIKLASLQYHIPNKDALIQALTKDIVLHYDEHLEPILRGKEDNPEMVLAEVIRWIRSPKDGEWQQVHRLEVQFWAMALIEPAVAKAQKKFFRGYRQFLAKLIQNINPSLSSEEAVRRGALMSVMIDGCALLNSKSPPHYPELENLTDELVTTALELAKRPPTS